MGKNLGRYFKSIKNNHASGWIKLNVIGGSNSEFVITEEKKNLGTDLKSIKLNNASGSNSNVIGIDFRYSIPANYNFSNK